MNIEIESSEAFDDERHDAPELLLMMILLPSCVILLRFVCLFVFLFLDEETELG